MLLRYVYIVFLGIILAVFVGVGIAAFYIAPKYPEYPSKLQRPYPPDPQKDATLSAEFQKEQEKYDATYKDFQKKNELYSKNVSIIALVFAVIFLIFSLLFANKLLLIADGMLLGGVLTLLYSIVRGFESGDEKFRFVVVSIGLVIALILGYLKFIKTSLAKDK